MSKLALMLLFCELAFSHLVRGSEPADTQEPIAQINYCELMKSPEDYNNRLIRVTGNYSTAFELSVFTSAACKELLTWVEFDPDSIEASGAKANKDFERLMAKTDREVHSRNMLTYYRRVRVTWVGRLTVTNEEGSAGGFGHLHCCRFLLTIVRIDEVKKEPAKRKRTSKKA